MYGHTKRLVPELPATHQGKEHSVGAVQMRPEPHIGAVAEVRDSREQPPRILDHYVIASANDRRDNKFGLGDMW